MSRRTSAVIILPLTHRCACGAPSTHRLRWAESSSRGVAVVSGPPRCARCASRDAEHLLADGASSVEGRTFPQKGGDHVAR